MNPSLKILPLVLVGCAHQNESTNEKTDELRPGAQQPTTSAARTDNQPTRVGRPPSIRSTKNQEKLPKDESCEIPSPSPGHWYEVWTCCGGQPCKGQCVDVPGQRVPMCACGTTRGCETNEICCSIPVNHCSATCEYHNNSGK